MCLNKKLEKKIAQKVLVFLSDRMKECSLHGVFSVSLFPNIPSAVELAKVNPFP